MYFNFPTFEMFSVDKLDVILKADNDKSTDE